MIFNRIIDRVLRMKSKMKFKSGGNKKALVSYILTPPIAIGSYFHVSHNNRYECFVLIKTLLAMGYNVTLQDCSKTTFEPDSYDLFIGHSLTFSTLADKVSAPCNILLVTGSNPIFGNEQQVLRAKYLQERKGVYIDVYGDNINPDAYPNFKKADLILMLGNDFVKKTWFPEFYDKIWLINNPTPVKPTLKKTHTGNFVFMSSVGQVHRGLDLVLDAFKERKARLYVCSRYKDEPEFEELYREELYGSTNIIPCGFIKIGGKEFEKIVADADYVILPSCSEGQSGSVVNLMARGLLPVISKNVGIEDVEKFGFEIRGDSVQHVAEAVDKAICCVNSELILKRHQLLGCMAEYSAHEVGEEFRKAIQSLTR